MTVFIVSSYYKTGGPESLHQLCSCLNSKGIDSYIYYMNQTELKSSLYVFPNIKSYLGKKDANGTTYPDSTELCMYILEQYGVDRKKLYRQSTTFSKRK